MITSTTHVLILVPVFFLLIKRRALRQGKLTLANQVVAEWKNPARDREPQPRTSSLYLLVPFRRDMEFAAFLVCFN
jgi:hypothetical protein